MRQLITRIDDDLHRRLKSRAIAEGRSVNALVGDLLRDGLARTDEEARVRARLHVAGLRVIPRLQGRPPSRDSAVRATRGAGTAAGEALTAERAAR